MISMSRITSLLMLLTTLRDVSSFTSTVSSPQVSRKPWTVRAQPSRIVSSSLRVLSNKELTEITTGTTTNASVPAAISETALAADASAGGQGEYNDAIRNTLGWVGASAAFGTALFFLVDAQTSEEFFAGYLLEQSLSVDNLLVFLLLFEYFKIPSHHQNRVLNWGIIGAIVMRAIMIGAGAVALQKFHAVLLIFAGILVYSSGKILLGGGEEDEEDMSSNSVVQFSNSIIASTDTFDGDRFFTIIDGVKLATPMLLCMVAVEVSDVVFAVDSIPAVFGVTENPLVVFSSNMFAIMGLRSLYTVLAKAASELKYLEPAVAVVLGFIGAKMIAEYAGAEIPTEVSLAVVATLLGGGVGASLLDKGDDDEEIETS